MSIIGYARVSTQDQNLDLQLAALKAAGCEKIFCEYASGGDKKRPELAKALHYCRDEDVFVVWKLDRAARSLRHLIEIADVLKGRGVALRSLTEPIDTTTAIGEMIFNVIGAIGQFERSLIQERTMAGLAAANAKGNFGGRRKGWTLDVLEERRKHKEVA